MSYTATVHSIDKWGMKYRRMFYSESIAQELASELEYIYGHVCWIEYLTPEVR